MKFKLHLVFIIFSILNFSACKQKIESPVSEINLKTKFPTYPVSFVSFETLNSNSFWFHSIENANPSIERIEHYDGDFKLLQSMDFTGTNITGFLADDDNSVLATLESYDSITKKTANIILKFDANINIIGADSSSKMHAYAEVKDSFFTHQRVIKLTDGKCIIALQAAQKSNSDSAHIVLAAFNNPITGVSPIWVNKNKYYDFSNEIYNTELIDMAADAKNNFYVLANVKNNAGLPSYLVVRKHASDGALIWQKNFFKSALPKNCKLNFDGENVIIGALNYTIFVLDKNGGITSIPINYSGFSQLHVLPNSAGYIAATDSVSLGITFTKLLQMNHQFKVLNSVLIGNQKTKEAILGKLADDKFVFACQIESPNLKKFNLAFYKLNSNLQLIK